MSNRVLPVKEHIPIHSNDLKGFTEPSESAVQNAAGELTASLGQFTVTLVKHSAR